MKQQEPFGHVVSELLTEASAQRQERKVPRKPFQWETPKMAPLIDLSDKEALYAALEERPE